MGRMFSSGLTAQPLWLRLTLLSLVTGILALLVLSGSYREIHRDFGSSEFSGEGRALVRVAAAGVLEPVITEDREELDTIVGVLSESSRAIATVRVFNERGDVLAGWTTADLPAASNLQRFSEDIHFEGERFGRVELKLDSRHHDRAFRQNLLELLVYMAIGIFVVVFVLLLCIHYQVVRPVQRMSARLHGEGAFRARRQKAFRGQAQEIAMLQQAVSASIMHARSSARRHAELREAHAQAEAALRAKSRFLSTMSHELRSPMSAVSGALRLLRDDQSSVDRAALAETADRSMSAIMRLVNDIIEYARAEDESETYVQSFDAAQLIGEVREFFLLEASAKNLAVQVQAAASCPTRVSGPAMRIRQVLLALTSNAVKFTDRGTVRLEVRGMERAGGCRRLRFTVRDTGPGITEQSRRYLFEEFRQLDEDYNRVHGGAGLGLALAQRLVARMNGEMGVESVPGLGSSFWFEVEVQAEALPVPRALQRDGQSPAVGPVGSLNGLRVLLVDDSDSNRLVAAAILNGLGAEVDEVNSGPAAVAAAGRAVYDVILMDLQMPGMSGWQAAQEIFSVPGPRPVMYALTANSSREDHARSLEAGMEGLIVKPASREKFLEVLASHALAVAERSAAA